MDGATDLAGAPRLVGDAVDMGCYEKEAMPENFVESVVTYSCVGTAEDGMSLDYAFSATITPPDADFTWYVDGVAQSTQSLAPVFTLSPSGDAHVIKLRAEKGSGESEYEARVSVIPVEFYCKAGNPNAAYPYDSEENAASSLADIFAAARPPEDTRMMTVTLLEGVHPVSGLSVYGPVLIKAKEGDDVSLDMQKIISGIWLYGPNAELRGVKIINGNDLAVKLYDGAVLRGCTIYNAKSTKAGSGALGIVRAMEGDVIDCVFDGCAGEYCYDNPALWMTKGTAANCRFENNGRMDYICRIDSEAVLTNSVFANNPQWTGGQDNLRNQILLTSGSVIGCQFLTNGSYTASRDGTIRVTGGVVRNCLLAGNKSYKYPGIYLAGNGVVENCTVVGGTDNPVAGANGLDLWMSAGTVRNSIFYSNPLRDGVSKSGGSLTYSVMPVMKDGEGNSTIDPLFENAPFDYSLSYDSLCRDSGTNQEWMTDAVDLAGNPRISQDVVDIGCYEGLPRPDDYLALTVVKECVGAGAVGDSLSFRLSAISPALDYDCSWYIDGTLVPGESENVLDISLEARPEPYSAEVRITAAGLSATSSVTLYVFPRAVYVSAEGASVYPYDTVEKAALSLADAFSVFREPTDSRKLEVRILPGEYTASELNVPRATTVTSHAGAGTAIIRGTKNPGLTVAYGDSALDGLVLKGVSSVVKLTGGSVRNCRFSDCAGATPNITAFTISGGLAEKIVFSNYYDKGWGYQYPISISAGVLRDFVIEKSSGCSYNLNVGGGIVSNGVIRNWGESTRNKQDAVEHGGIKVSSGLVTHCVLTNLGDKVASRTGAILLYGNGIVRNCLVAGNYSTDCAGVNMSGGLIENCTVVVDEGASTHLTGYAVLGSALNMTGGTARNCVFWSKERPEAGKYYVRKTGGTLENCWVSPMGADPALTGQNVLTGTDPMLRSARNFAPSSASPLINAGKFLDWMTGAVDLAGRPRVAGKGVDIGAYESASGFLRFIVR